MKFSKNEIEKILNYINSIEEFDSSDISNKQSRHYKYKVITNNSETKWIFDTIDEYFKEKDYIEIIKPLNVLYFHKYETGDFFIRHVDTDYAIHNVGVCLNDDYEGGDFIVYNPKEILPKSQGAIYDFNSKREHEVTPILKGERMSIIGFFQKENLNLNKKKTLI